ncbi:hypothetical protein U9M48_011957 [Paspalum notatum var. saurae]|uniref:Myb-like domain-containing protein n=1 Tax=Paspalum notatum var. saurae TaxID=547442 RepID=A0AAQ3SWN8_PASNO
MPPLSASATASRFASLWVTDAIAGDEALEFSVFKELVGGSSKSLAGAPEATRERVALRCLQEVSSIAAAGDAAAATPGVLRVDEARSCEDFLLQLIGEVGSSGNLEKDLLPPFSQDIQEIIRTKKLTSPEISLQLLREVDPGIKSIAPPSELEQNGTKQCDNDQSLCGSHERVNIEKPMFPTDNAELQQETLANLVDDRDSGNLQKDPTAPTSILEQPCTSDSRSYVPPQEDAIADVGLGARSPEKSHIVEGNISVGSVLVSDGCETPFPGSINEPFPQQGTEDCTTLVEPQSCRPKSPNLAHCVDEESPHDGGTSKQSSKDPNHEELSGHATVTPGFGRTSDALPTDASEPGHLPEFSTVKETTMISEPQGSKTDLSDLQHESGEKVNQDLENISASIRSVEKYHAHEDLTLQTASAPSMSCNSAVQGGISETNHHPGNATEHTVVFEGQNGDKSHLEVSGANKANQALHNDGSISENNTVHGGLTAQTAPVPQNCNVTLHDKTLEVNCLSGQNTGNNGTDVQQRSCHTSIPGSAQDGNGQDANKTSNKENLRHTSPEICVPSSVDSFQATAAAGLLLMADRMMSCSKDKDTNDTLEGLSQQDLCIKCGNDGQLLKCSVCLLAAHDSCFGLPVTFEETGPFYCPLCFYKKATEAYQKAKEAYGKARKNLAAFLGNAQVVKQHDEQQTGVQPGAANRDGHSDGKGIHQNEGHDLAHQEEESHEQRKKQKLNGRGNGCPKEVLTENDCFRNSGVAPKNKDPVLQNNSSKQVQDREKKQQVEDKEAGNDESSHETRASQERCGPRANQDAEADEGDGFTAASQSGDPDEIEAASSNDSGKRSSPPWRNMRDKKTRLQETEPVVSRKRNYAYPQKRYSNPCAPPRRRSKLCWTEEEETFLREAMAKFTPTDGAPIPWVRILEYGSLVFHNTRLPSDLRVKWRNMKKKLADS